MKKIFLTLAITMGLLGAGGSSTALANPLTMAQVQAQLPIVKDQTRRFALIKFFNECKSKRLFHCQLAWFDLNAAGLDMIYHVKTGLETWEFSNDPQSTSLYRSIAIALTHPNYRDGWDLMVRAKYKSDDVPTEAPAREGLHDDTWHFATLDIVNQHFQSVGITYAVDKGFTDPRAEWLRYLALVFAVRGDSTNSLTAINELKSYAKINKDNALLYNDTLFAVQKYLNTIGVRK